MKREEFQKLFDRTLVLDGATGTELQKRGLPAGVSPEKWVMANPDAMILLQREYFAAGSDAVLSFTFGGNRIKLAEYGMGQSVREVNRKLVEISREAAGAGGLVAGDISATGAFVSPFGELGFEEAVDIFKEQVAGILDGGADFFFIETMFDIQEARAALIAAKETCDLPVCVSMTFNEDGREVGEKISDAVVSGNSEVMKDLVEEALAEGRCPYKLTDERLIPAITRVGDLYEKKPYFLPQLIQSAEAMKKAFEILEPHLEKAEEGAPKRAAVVLATVKGDIHDIGKNIVALMMRNYGFMVHDLGKDVDARAIVDKARETGAAIIGLSALMTTTMVQMKTVVDLAREEGLSCRIMLGGGGGQSGLRRRDRGRCPDGREARPESDVHLTSFSECLIFHFRLAVLKVHK